MLSGALRRLVQSLCSDYDDAHRFLLSIETGYSTKCSAHVADISGLFACQLICIRSVFAQGIIHHIISLSGCSDLIGKNCSIPDKAAFFICAALIEPKNLHDFLRQFIVPILLRFAPLLLGQLSDFLASSRSLARGVKVTFSPLALAMSFRASAMFLSLTALPPQAVRRVRAIAPVSTMASSFFSIFICLYPP